MAHPDDIVVWPDGTTATREEVERGDYSWKSDDYEVLMPFEDDLTNADKIKSTKEDLI